MDEFQQSLLRTRSRSLSRGKSVRFLIDSENRKFSIEGGSREFDIPQEVQVEGEGIGEIDTGIYGITFYPDGSSSGGEIDLTWEDGTVIRFSVDKLLGIIKQEKIQS